MQIHIWLHKNTQSQDSGYLWGKKGIYRWHRLWCFIHWKDYEDGMVKWWMIVHGCPLCYFCTFLYVWPISSFFLIQWTIREWGKRKGDWQEWRKGKNINWLGYLSDLKDVQFPWRNQPQAIGLKKSHMMKAENLVPAAAIT